MAFSKLSTSILLISFNTFSITLWTFLTLHSVVPTKPSYKILISSVYFPLPKKPTLFKRKVLHSSYCLLCSSLRDQFAGLIHPHKPVKKLLFFSDNSFENCIVFSLPSFNSFSNTSSDLSIFGLRFFNIFFEMSKITSTIFSSCYSFIHILRRKMTHLFNTQFVLFF